MRIERVSAADARHGGKWGEGRGRGWSEEWDAFVASRPEACLGHASAWPGILARAYGLRVHALLAREAGGRLRGVLPLAELRTLRGARTLVSLPFLDAAGILAEDEETEGELHRAALALARERGIASLELRQLEALAGAVAAGDAGRVDLVLPLAEDEEAQWKALPAKVRNQTRKAAREGLRIADDGDARRADFYGVFQENMRDLGSPVHSRGFYEALAEGFGGRARFVVTGDERAAAGGLVAIDFAGTVTVPWASTRRSERSRCPNNALYWEALRWAVSRRAQLFDFGRSPVGSGTHRFKKGWGARERPLAWLRCDAAGAPLALEDVRGNPVLARLSALWTRLPLGLANRLGPAVRRHLPS